MDYAKVVDGKAVRIKTVDDSDTIAITKLLAHGYVTLSEGHTVDLELFPCYTFGERGNNPENGWEQPTYKPWKTL